MLKNIYIQHMKYSVLQDFQYLKFGFTIYDEEQTDLLKD